MLQPAVLGSCCGAGQAGDGARDGRALAAAGYELGQSHLLKTSISGGLAFVCWRARIAMWRPRRRRAAGACHGNRPPILRSQAARPLPLCSLRATIYHGVIIILWCPSFCVHGVTEDGGSCASSYCCSLSFVVHAITEDGESCRHFIGVSLVMYIVACCLVSICYFMCACYYRGRGVILAAGE